MVFDNFYAGKRVLVTGDSGFKGPWLCEWLVGLGADVLGIGLEPNTTPSLFDALAMEERIAHEYLDVRSFEDLRGYVRRFQPDLVFHLAAQSLVRRSYREPLETIATNVLGTAHLLAAVDDARVSGASLCPVIVVTSDKCYENDGLRLEPFKESDPMGGHDLYSASKGAAELIVHAW
jgi:CDP-glucose 4,6-dehydratase